MAMSVKDALGVLPLGRRVSRKLTKDQAAALVKGYKTAGTEPKNKGVPKRVGPQMIRALARHLERQDEK